MVAEAVAAAPDPEAVRLGAADVPEMLALIEQTNPGPFLPRTVEMGTYLGIRRQGRLIAMAGERLHPPGFTEISAVCTDAAFRGEGLATRLVLAVAHGIRARGETPFLHAAAATPRDPALRGARFPAAPQAGLRRRTGPGLQSIAGLVRSTSAITCQVLSVSDKPCYAAATIPSGSQ